MNFRDIKRALLFQARLGMAVAVVGAAGYFAASNSWPWPRPALHTPPLQVAPAQPTYEEVQDTLRYGETLSELFARQGLRSTALSALPAHFGFDPRRLKAGLVFSFHRLMGDSVPTRILVRASPEQRLTFERVAGGWTARTDEVRWIPQLVRLDGRIDASLYEALDAQVPDSLFDSGERMRLAWDLADVYAWQVDFTRDIQPGDNYHVVVERLTSEEGEVRFGRILAGRLSIGGRELAAYVFEPEPGEPGYYDAEGLSLKRAFLRAPLQFRRISSRFSRGRMHPILGRVRRHEGTDYAAAPGTPVMAAGNGVVVKAGRAGGYGNLIELRHSNGITTRYGHLRGFAQGVRVGARVSQGDIIGFVGTTGLSTGPHLHYEFRVNGVARDPRGVDLGHGEPIPPAARAAFEHERLRYDLLLATPAGAVASR